MALFRISGKAAVVGTAALLTLTACGGQVKMGAAATFDSSRITTATLDQTVNDWSKEYAANPAADQVRQQISAQSQGAFDVSSPPRLALLQLIDFRLWDEVARERGMDITPGVVDDFIARSGGIKVVDLNTLARGLPTSESKPLARAIVIQSRVAGVDANGQVADPAAAQKAITDATHQAAAALKVDVNPRYGTYDLTTGFGPVTYHLSKPDPGLNGA